MKVKFYCDSGANIHSNRDSGWLDTVEDFGFEPGEWETFTSDEKYKLAEEWAWEKLDIGYEEKE